MPPIQIYSSSAVNATKAAKAAGVTPQTAGPDTKPQTQAATTTATTLPTRTSEYPPPQPGSRPPGPTGVVSYSPPAPATTTAAAKVPGQHASPPEPQPGAVPVPPGRTTTLPPPPRAGESMAMTSGPTTMPPQMSVPPPTRAHPAQHGSFTVTATLPTGPRPTSIMEGPSAAGQPPHTRGPQYYQQQQGYGADGTTSGYGQPYSGSPAMGPSGQGHIGNRGFGEEGNGEGVWDTAKKWAQAAGDSLAAAEREAWRRINNS